MRTTGTLPYCLIILFLSVGWMVGKLSAETAKAPATSLCALIVGGGPDVSSNAAQIEGHTRFVAGLVPAGERRIVLFADGKAAGESVSYADTSEGADTARALGVLLAGEPAEQPVLHRAPKLEASLDGPSQDADFRRSLSKLASLAANGPAPLLLYFAGHGSQDKNKDRFTYYNLWNGEKLTVRELANELARLPRQVPVVLVMAQCFSGAFGDALFSFGEFDKAPLEQNVAGFFSARRDREASGCSYATERADYQDFSSYFFGALSGQDRFGDKVEGADYDGDGTVSLHEAFCYALIHDPSADTPVCTSDVFLERKAFQPNEVIFSKPYQEVWVAATPGQRAALDALSVRLGLSGDARALTAFDRLNFGDPATRPAILQTQMEEKNKLNALRQPLLGTFFEHWPALRWGKEDTEPYKKALDGAVEELRKTPDQRRHLLEASKAQEAADEAVDDEEAMLLRFTSVYKHVVEAKALSDSGKPEVKSRFERLWQAEQGTLPLGAAAH